MQSDWLATSYHFWISWVGLWPTQYNQKLILNPPIYFIKAQDPNSSNKYPSSTRLPINVSQYRFVAIAFPPFCNHRQWWRQEQTRTLLKLQPPDPNASPKSVLKHVNPITQTRKNSIVSSSLFKSVSVFVCLFVCLFFFFLGLKNLLYRFYYMIGGWWSLLMARV